MIPASIFNYLDRHHARYSLMSHPTAYTAQEEAAAAHVSGYEWAKAVVCFADGQPILAVLPAPFAVDVNRLRRAVAAHTLRLATEAEFAHLYQDCEVGAMPPLGPLYGQRVIVDKKLAADREVAFSAGSHHDTIRMPYPEFQRLAQPTLAEFASSSNMAASVSEKSSASDVVRRGGIAESEAEIEDVTRDTYGFPAAAPTAGDREERLAGANRAAEREGIPGVEVPESRFEIEERIRKESALKSER